MTYRDSVGRIRTDAVMSVPPIGSNAQPRIIRLAEIDDPVTGYRYILDSFHQIAHRVVPCKQLPGPALAATELTEDLGTKTMFGVTVTGERQTTILPAGPNSANDAPVTMVNETWHSAQYGLDLFWKRILGDQETIVRIEDFIAGDPDPALFRVPDGYKVVDETSQFSITIPAP